MPGSAVLKLKNGEKLKKEKETEWKQGSNARQEEKKKKKLTMEGRREFSGRGEHGGAFGMDCQQSVVSVRQAFGPRGPLSPALKPLG